MMNISEFISNLHKWSICHTNINQTQTPVDLYVCHSRRNLSPSYLLVFSQQTQTPLSLVPITNQLALLVSDNTLIVQYKNYENMQVVYSIQDFRHFQVFVTDFVNCISNGDIRDPFRDMNQQFLFRNSTKPEQIQNIISQSSVQFHDPTQFPKGAGSIAAKNQQRSLWEQNLMLLNSQYAAELKDLRFSVITWNVASVKPHPMVIDEINQAFQCGKEKADCVFIALQEIDMGVVSIVAGSTGVSDKWSKIVAEAVQRSVGAYEVIAEETLGGVFAAVIVRRDANPRLIVNHIKTVRLGVMGMAANKGAAIFYCNVGITRFVLIGCHLSPHTEHWQQRNDQIKQLLRTVAGQYDYLVFVGDLNYRITLSYEETLQLINQNQIGQLLSRDQLRISMANDRDIGTLKEPPLQFMPTYKFDKNSAIYDTSPKKRVPSWTDRILVKRAPKRLCIGTLQEPTLDVHQSPQYNFPQMPKCVAFRRGVCQFSDHRSVTLSYVFKIPVVNQDKLTKVKQAIQNYIKKVEAENSPSLEFSQQYVSTLGGQITISNKTSSWIKWSAEPGACGMNIQPSRGVLFPNEQANVSFTPSGGKTGGQVSFVVEGGKNSTIAVTDNPSQQNVSSSATSTTSTQSQQQQAEVDLFGTSPTSSSVNTFSNANTNSEASIPTTNIFDPFGTTPVQGSSQKQEAYDPFSSLPAQQNQPQPAQASSQSQQDDTFDPFASLSNSSSSQQPQKQQPQQQQPKQAPQNAFDLFGSSSAAATPQQPQQQSPQNAFDLFGSSSTTPQQPKQQGSQNAFDLFGSSPQTQQQQPQQQTNSNQTNTFDPFGVHSQNNNNDSLFPF